MSSPAQQADEIASGGGPNDGAVRPQPVHGRPHPSSSGSNNMLAETAARTEAIFASALRGGGVRLKDNQTKPTPAPTPPQSKKLSLSATASEGVEGAAAGGGATTSKSIINTATNGSVSSLGFLHRMMAADTTQQQQQQQSTSMATAALSSDSGPRLDRKDLVVPTTTAATASTRLHGSGTLLSSAPGSGGPSSAYIAELDRVRSQLRGLTVAPPAPAAAVAPLEPAMGTGAALHGGFSLSAAAPSATRDAITSHLQQELDRVTRTLEQERAELRRREQEHVQTVQRLLTERTERQREELTRSQAVASFERELSIAVEAMTTERRRSQEQLAASQRAVHELSTERDARARDCDELREQVAAAREEAAGLRRRLEQTQRQATEAEASFARERAELQRAASRAQTQLAERARTQGQELATARAEAVTGAQKVGELREQLEALRARDTEARDLARTVSRLESEVELAKRHAEAAESRNELRLQERIEVAVAERLGQAKERAAQSEAELRAAHRNALETLSQRHAADQDAIFGRFEQELARAKEDLQTERRARQQEVQALQQELHRAKADLTAHATLAEQQQAAVVRETAQLNERMHEVLANNFKAAQQVSEQIASVARRAQVSGSATVAVGSPSKSTTSAKGLLLPTAIPTRLSQLSAPASPARSAAAESLLALRMSTSTGESISSSPARRTDSYEALVERARLNLDQVAARAATAVTSATDTNASSIRGARANSSGGGSTSASPRRPPLPLEEAVRHPRRDYSRPWAEAVPGLAETETGTQLTRPSRSGVRSAVPAHGMQVKDKASKKEKARPWR